SGHVKLRHAPQIGPMTDEVQVQIVLRRKLAVDGLESFGNRFGGNGDLGSVSFQGLAQEYDMLLRHAHGARERRLEPQGPITEARLVFLFASAATENDVVGHPVLS